MNLQVVPHDQEIDLDKLSKDLDRTKSTVFLSKKNAAFLGSLMCSLNFMWNRDIGTAGTDGVTLQWNPDYFNVLPKDSRSTDLQHELWHVALLHNVRRGTRNPDTWNIACDIKIDLMLEAEGCTFVGIEGVHRDPKYIGWAEEDIYDDLIKNNPPISSKCTCCSHQLPDSDGNIQATINAVVQAVHQAKLSGQAGNLPGGIEQTLKQFLEPVIPWQVVLMQFFTDLLNEDYSWKRPNRRYVDMYLPSRFTDDGRLEHLMYFLDVSGSITDKDVIRFNSEVKYIQEVLKPQRLTLVQFDTVIQDVKEFKEEEPFNEILVKGRGGTSWAPVKEYIDKTLPTAVVVFTDMGFWDAVVPLNSDIPIIWVAINNPSATPPFGKMIHIK